MKKRFTRFMSGKRIQTQRRLGMFLIEQEMAKKEAAKEAAKVDLLGQAARTGETGT